jgi:hypothetical protein
VDCYFNFRTPLSFFDLKTSTMATQSARVYKQTLVKMLNYVKPGNGWTVDSVLSVEDLTLTDVQVMSWFNLKVWGHPDPAPDHGYVPQVRSNSILYWNNKSASLCPTKCNRGITLEMRAIQRDATRWLLGSAK